MISINEATKAEWYCVDTETTGVNYAVDRVIGVSLLLSNGTRAYVSVRHLGHDNAPIEYLRRLFKALEGKTAYGYNIKFDAHMLAKDSVYIQPSDMYDVKILVHTCNNDLMNYGLKRVADTYLGKGSSKEEKELNQLLKARKKEIDKQTGARGGSYKTYMQYLSPDEVAPYAIQDVVLTKKLYDHFYGMVDEDFVNGLQEYNRAIYEMERVGLPVDVKLGNDLMVDAEANIQKIKAELVRLSGKRDFNPNSSPQVCRLLGVQSSAKSVISDLGTPEADLVIKYRESIKALSSFYEPMISHTLSGRLIPSLDTVGTKTGRLSCRHPNLQALPKNKKSHRARALVKAPEGRVLMAADYSQLELRLLANTAKVKFLIDAFTGGGDVHQATADMIGVDREKAKRINYGIVYGIGAASLSSEMGVPESEARSMLNRYHGLMPEITTLLKYLERMAYDTMTIKYWTGRVKTYDSIDGHVNFLSHFIQGGAAEVVRLATVSTFNRVHGKLGHMLLQIHDELLLEVDEDMVSECAAAVKECMEDFGGKVKMEVDIKVGKDWANMEAINGTKE